MKLFKTLRQNLIKQGNIKKYLFYALGEILLVMIGISLAFQLDNWNDDRIKKNVEMQYYENIKDQIIDDKELIIGQREYNSRYKSQFKHANDIIASNNRSKLDTLGKIVRNLTTYSDFDRQGNIYETMVNSGQINLLQNHDIVNGIRKLEEKYIYMNRMENIHYDAIMKHVVLAVNPVLDYATNEIKKPDAVFNYEFQNLTIILIQVMNEKDKVYNEGLAEIERVIQLIDEELDNQ